MNSSPNSYVVDPIANKMRFEMFINFEALRDSTISLNRVEEWPGSDGHLFVK